MNGKHINFNQQRTFGQVLNSSFSFIRQNFTKLGGALVFFAGPFLLLQGIARVYFAIHVGNLAAVVRANPESQMKQGSFMYSFFLIIASLVTIAMISTTVLNYIKLYIEKGKEGFSQKELWKVVIRSFPKTLWATIILALIIGIGAIMCVVPGIFLGISFSLFLMVLVFENNSVKATFSRTFKLARYHWWWIFLMFMVIIVVIYVFSMIFEVPSFIFRLSYGMNSLDNGKEIPEVMKYVLIAFKVLSSFASSLLTSILFVALSFEYFAIVEKKENPDLHQKISDIQNSRL